MLIRLKRVRDGVVLTCVRGGEGGSVAVQRTGHGGFFALHDLMHHAVETALGFRRAFFGLMAEGWSFETFGDRTDPRYRAMPPEAIWAENLVAILSRLYADRAWRDAELLPLWIDDVNRELAAVLTQQNARPFRLEAAQAVEIYRRFGELADRWMAVPVGEHLEISFSVYSRACSRR